MPDISGIWKDPKTTIVGILAVCVTIGLVVGELDAKTWMALIGFLLGGRWILENKPTVGDE